MKTAFETPNLYSNQNIQLLTVNLHLKNRCSFKCRFCYAHFNGMKSLSFFEWKEILIELKNYGILKINFAGGEPFLFKELGSLVMQAKIFRL